MESSKEEVNEGVKEGDWNQIETKGIVPPPKNGHTLVEYNGSIFCFGGYDGNNHFNQLEMFTFDEALKSGKWVPIATQSQYQPSGRTLHTSVVYKDCMYVFGGTGKKETKGGFWSKPVTTQVELNELLEFNFTTLSWREVPTGGIPPSPRDGHTAVVKGDKMYIFGGSDDTTVFSDVFVLDLNTFAWLPVETKGSISARRLHTAVLHTTTTGPTMYIYGGYNGKQCFDDVFAFHFETNSWSHFPTKGSVPLGRYGHSAVVTNNSMFVFAGYGSGQGYRKDLYKLNLDNQEWSIVNNINCPIVRRRHSAILFEGTMIVMGGVSLSLYLNDLHLFRFLEQPVPEIPEETLKMDLGNLLNTPEFSDVVFLVENSKIFAHKNILSVRSEYFRSIFRSTMIESTSGEIKISEFSYKSVYELLRYLYTGELNIGPEIALEVMKLSERYLLNRPKILCEMIVMEAIDCENACDLLMEADRYGCEKLKKFCIEFVVKNDKEVVNTETFLSLPKEIMVQIMKAISSRP